MRKQEFNSKHLPSPARRGSRSRTASPPAPLAIRKTPSGRRRKSRRQSHKFFKHLLRLAPQLAATPWGGSPPRPLRQKICNSDCTENCPLAGGAEGSFLCSLSSRFSGGGGGVGSLPRAWRRVGVPPAASVLKKFVKIGRASCRERV